MPDSNLNKTVAVKVQQRSGFDKSFRNLLTTTPGTLTPLVCDEYIPNTDGKLRIALSASLPPLASETFMQCDLKVEAFMVPTRLLMQGYDKWLSGDNKMKVGTPGSYQDGVIRAPIIELVPGAPQTDNYVKPGSLADYLGVKLPSTLPSSVNISAFPFLAYHLIWDEFYRNPQIQKSVFNNANVYNTNGAWSPMDFKTTIPNDKTGYTTTLGTALAVSGFQLGDLHQRNFGMDYFTAALPSPQFGDAFGIGVDSQESGDSGDWVFGTDSFSSRVANGNRSNTTAAGFTIAALRAANSLQQFAERTALASPRFVDYLKGHFNAHLKDSIAQRPVYLGSASYPVYSKGIYQTADATASNNPFTSVGSRFGHAYAEGSDFVCEFHFDEPGYLMVLVSLVPQAVYGSGMKRSLLRYTKDGSHVDLADPILQNVGMQPLYVGELSGRFVLDGADYEVFGYVDRFADWMQNSDELHGLVRDGQSLQAFALQRTFSTNPQLGSNFLEIPISFMDQVSAVTSDISSYGVWIDSFIDIKCVMPLQRYCLPSLQDPAYEHGDTVVLQRNGSQIS